MSVTFSRPLITPQNLDGLAKLWRELDEMRDTADRIAAVEESEIAEEALRISSSIGSFEPTVTLIGQIKAGKTALVNAMIGQTDLLPSDVNPWTSVVTSLHLNSRNRPEKTQAIFRFFDEEEWERLVSTGGRLGELAQRAGFDSEQEAVRDQVLAMREKSRARLGKRFELLLGTSHTYEMVTHDLIDRYVCYGGWDDADGEASKGRYADITKLANLYLDLPGYPTGLCLRDTPGVNDTFMMREQITLNSIRDSRLCVVVLSAHQALSTMDMALLRLVATVDSRELVIFVNRIDELDDPKSQIPEIEANFRVTLRKHDVAVDVPIVFGSALWAQAALADSVDALPAPSRLALLKWSEANPKPEGSEERESQQDRTWRICGVPDLHARVSEALIAGPGQAMLHETRDALANLVTSIEAADGSLRLNTADLPLVDQDALKRRIDSISIQTAAALKDANRFAIDALSERLTKSQSMFCDRAVEALQSHIEAYGTDKAWQYNPAGLRMMLRTGYKAFCTEVERTTAEICDDARRRLENVYTEFFEIEPDRISLKTPSPARAAPPTVVGKTIALDLNVSWWRKWWQGLRKQKPAAERYADLIICETNSILEELSHEMAPVFCRENEAILTTFVDAQRTALLSLAEPPEKSGGRSKRSAAKVEVLEEARRLIEAQAA